MPPVISAPQNTRGTLISWLIVFVILFITAAVFAIFCDVQWNKDNKTLTDLRAKYAPAASESEVSNLGDFTGDTGGTRSNGSALAVIFKQRNESNKLITGTEKASPADVQVRAHATLKAITDELSAKGVSVSLPDNLLQSIRILGDQVRASNDAAAKAQADAKAATDSATKVTQERDKLLAAKDTELATVRSEMEKAQKENQTYQSQKNTDFSSTQENAKVAIATANSRAEALQNAYSEANRQLASSQEGLHKLQFKLDHLRLNPNDAMQQPDGLIQKVPDEKTAYISIGQSESVTPGLTFEVYDGHRKLPKLASPGVDNNGADLDLPQGKASIEVVRVNQHTSECRIVRTSPGQHINVGDFIENLVYDPHTKYNFFVFGSFDMTQPGIPSKVDADLIRDLVTRWGGKLQTEVNVDTDFVVLGKEPVVPALADDEKTNALAVRRYEEALKASTAYQEIVRKATDLRLPLLNQNRFLYFTGYFDQAKR